MKHDDAFPRQARDKREETSMKKTVFPQGGVQLVAPSPKPGRLVVCSSAYWTGGEMKDGNIIKPGDRGSRYSFTMIRCRNALLILPPFLLLMKSHFIKTGSGQTQAKLSKMEPFRVVSRSDDHGENWRIGSKQVQPYHTTECSVAQSYDGTGDLYLLRAHTEQISSAGLSFNLPLNLDLDF